MRSIFLLLSRNGRRWLCAAALAFTWLGVCQPAAAAVSCSASTQPVMIYYMNSNPGNFYPANQSELLTTVSCMGFTGSSTNQFIICSTTTPGTQYASNPSGNQIGFNLLISSGNANIYANNPIATGSLGSSSSGGVANNATFVRAPLVQVPYQFTKSDGDYVATIPLTVEIRTANQSSAISNCSSGTSAGLVTLSLPITIRVGGADCAINNVENVNFGDISVNGAGRVAAITIPNTVEITCSRYTSWTITLLDGNNPSGTGTYRRQMVNGSSFLAYGFGRTSSNPQTTFTITGTFSGSPADFNTTEQITFYAFLQNQTPTSLTPGVYRDTVIMSVAY